MRKILINLLIRKKRRLKRKKKRKIKSIKSIKKIRKKKNKNIVLVNKNQVIAS